MNEMEKMIECMNKEDKKKMMEQCCCDMSSEDMNNMMDLVMPKMMECCKEGETLMISQMMTKMLPNCLSMMFPLTPKENRVEFAKNIVSALIEKGPEGMSEEEKEEFKEKILEGFNN